VPFAVFASAVCLFVEAGSSHRRASDFLVRDKKVTTKEARLPTASGGTRCALTALRSNSRRKNEGLPEVGARRLRAREPY